MRLAAEQAVKKAARKAEKRKAVEVEAEAESGAMEHPKPKKCTKTMEVAVGPEDIEIAAVPCNRYVFGFLVVIVLIDDL